MKINIVEEDKEKIKLEWTEIVCPYCNNDDIWVKNHCKDVELSSKKLQKFFKKRVILKKQRYICKNCHSTFHCKTVFTEGIFSQELKPILKILSEENIINEKPLAREIVEKLKLNINSEWAILNESKVLTLLNKDNCEIKEFLKIEKNKTEIIKQDGKEWENTRKIIEYKPLNRKAKHKILLK